jgi:hypothetical protein
MLKSKRYIVFPDGAISCDEIKETVRLLKYEGANPKIVKHNGFWNVHATHRMNSQEGSEPCSLT